MPYHRYSLGLLLVLLSTFSRADTFVLHNINGYDLDGLEVVRFSALAVQDGRVIARGDETLRESYNWPTRDGEGRTVLPGLIDAHGHIMRLGEALSSVDLVGTGTRREAVARVASFAADNAQLEWITGRGWNQTLWPENRFPSAADLDAAVRDRPVYLQRIDGHAAWVNSHALALAGIDASTPDPTGGVIMRNSDGQATGVLIDRAMDLVEAKIPIASASQRELWLTRALEAMAAVGLTGAHDAGTTAEEWQTFRDFAAQNKLTARLYAMISGAGDIFDTLAAQGPHADDWLSLRSVKIYSDGALGSRGAALLTDYSDDPGNRGLLFDDTAAFAAQFEKVSRSGFQIGVHAIGDRGNRTVLDAFAQMRQKHGADGLRHRVEHAQILSVEDIERFVELELIASIQPTHATSDMNMAEDRLGAARMDGAYAWRRFLDLGVVIAGGSDFPVEAVNPFFGLHAAITRQDHRNQPADGWYPTQRLSRAEALRSFTRDAAYSAHREHELGSLAPGYHADFIVLDRDYFSIPEQDIHAIQVLETWVAGRRVYPAP